MITTAHGPSRQAPAPAPHSRQRMARPKTRLPRGLTQKRGRRNLDYLWPAHVIRKALEDYSRGEETAKAIAARYGVDVKRLRRWAASEGCPRPPLGRRPQLEPSSEQKYYLKLVGSLPLARIAGLAGFSKQYLSELAKRWPEWLGPGGIQRHRGRPPHQKRATVAGAAKGFRSLVAAG
jgi:hypothetical protein